MINPQQFLFESYSTYPRSLAFQPSAAINWPKFTTSHAYTAHADTNESSIKFSLERTHPLSGAFGIRYANGKMAARNIFLIIRFASSTEQILIGHFSLEGYLDLRSGGAVLAPRRIFPGGAAVAMAAAATTTVGSSH